MLNLIIGQRRPSPSYTKAISDGWVAGKNLFSISQAADKGTLIAYLLSDAGQVAVWPQIKKYLTRGKTLYFSHGFAVSYSRLTKVIIPGNIDVILVAPKGAGRSVRKNFLEGRGINSSFAVFQNASGKAKEKALAMGIAIGSGFLFETTFEKEVYSDLTGERGVLMGAIAGIMVAGMLIKTENILFSLLRRNMSGQDWWCLQFHLPLLLGYCLTASLEKRYNCPNEVKS